MVEGEKVKRLNPNIVKEGYEDYIYLELSRDELIEGNVRDIILDLLGKNKRLDAENYHLKNQLKHINQDIINLRKNNEKLKKQCQSKRKERYKNVKRG